MKCTSIHDELQVKFCNGFKWYPVDVNGGDKTDRKNDATTMFEEFQP